MESKKSVGIALPLTVIFIILKLVGVIDWDWVWVLLPLWLPVAFGLFLLCAAAVIVGIWTMVEEMFK